MLFVSASDLGPKSSGYSGSENYLTLADGGRSTLRPQRCAPDVATSSDMDTAALVVQTEGTVAIGATAP